MIKQVWRFIRNPVALLDGWWMVHSPKRRLDRNPLYPCLLLGIMGPAMSIIAVGPIPNSSLAGLGEGIQIFLCGLIFIGGSICLYASVIGDREKHSYRLHYGGAPAVVAALFTYGWVILSNVTLEYGATLAIFSALSGILTPMLGLGVALQAVLFWLESRRIERNEETIIKRLADGHGEH